MDFTPAPGEMVTPVFLRFRSFALATQWYKVCLYHMKTRKVPILYRGGYRSSGMLLLDSKTSTTAPWIRILFPGRYCARLQLQAAIRLMSILSILIELQGWQSLILR